MLPRQLHPCSAGRCAGEADGRGRTGGYGPGQRQQPRQNGVL